MTYFAEVNSNSALNDYCNALPKNITTALGKAAFRGLCIGIIFGNPIAGVALSVTATLVHALITPFFKEFYSDRTHLKFADEVLRSFSAISIVIGAVFLIDGGTAYSLIETSLLISLISLSLFSSNRSLSEAGVVLVV